MGMVATIRDRTVAASVLSALLSGCALDPAAARSGASIPSQAARLHAMTKAPENVAGASAHAADDETAHQAQMRHLHHQGHSRHEFRAIHNMDDMHRMGGVPDMRPLDEYKDHPSQKMGAVK